MAAVTSGGRPRPADFLRLGKNRQKESISALASIGVEERELFFLGYPDAGLAPLWSIHWPLSNPYRSIGTEVYRSPYRGADHDRAIHAGEAVARDLGEIIAGFRPTMVALPHPNDQHPDHWATHAFVRYALIRAGLDPIRLLYLVHRRNWPALSGVQPMMLPPGDLMSHGTAWCQLPLTEPTALRKRHGIALHQSQMEVMAGFLEAFGRENELFGQYPDLMLPMNQERPPAIINDPVGDYRAVRSRPAADLAMVKANRDGKLLLVYLQPQTKPKKKIGYGIDLTVFALNGEAHRLCAIYADQKVQILVATGQDLGGQLKVEAGENAIRFALCLERLGEVKSVMINGFTRAGRREIDRTAWRLLSLD